MTRVAGAALLALIVVLAVSMGGPAPARSDATWLLAASTETVAGGSLHLDPGAVYVVNVWASWCLPCRREQPVLERMARSERERGVRFVGINVRDTRADARTFVKEFSVSYPSIFDPSGEFAHRVGVSRYPSTIVLDRSGRVRERYSGPVGAAALKEAIGRLLTG